MLHQTQQPLKTDTSEYDTKNAKHSLKDFVDKICADSPPKNVLRMGVSVGSPTWWAGILQEIIYNLTGSNEINSNIQDPLKKTQEGGEKEIKLKEENLKENTDE